MAIITISVDGKKEVYKTEHFMFITEEGNEVRAINHASCSDMLDMLPVAVRGMFEKSAYNLCDSLTEKRNENFKDMKEEFTDALLKTFCLKVLNPDMKVNDIYDVVISGK